MKIENVVKIENGFKIVVSKRIYEKEAVTSVAYKFCKKYIITLDNIDDEHLSITLQPKYNSIEPSLEDVESILADLIDEQLRLEILNRTKVIREIIYKKAFEPLQEKEK